MQFISHSETIAETHFKRIKEEFITHSQYLSSIEASADNISQIEEANNGLVIIEAYLGNYDHIQKIASGTMKVWLNLSSISEYRKCEIIEVTPIFVMHISNSKLVLGKECMKWEGVIFPCVSKSQKIGYFLRFKHRGVEFKIIKAISQVFRIPDDLLC